MSNLITKFKILIKDTIWLNPDTFVIEIFNTDLIDTLFHCLSKRLNLFHTFIITSKFKSNESFNVHFSDLFIDEEQLFQKLKEFDKL